MISRRKFIVVLGGAALAAPLAGFPQKPEKVPRVGVLAPGFASSVPIRIEALRAGLQDFGYVEGKTIVIEWRWADGKYERLSELAADLVRLKVGEIELTVFAALPITWTRSSRARILRTCPLSRQ
jgi:putative ABC transport system substrate-binding protein